MLSTFTKICQGTPDLVKVRQNISGTLHDDIRFFFFLLLASSAP